MNPVEIEKTGDERYSLTLPDGSKKPSLSAQEVLKSLQHKAKEFQGALDDITKHINHFEELV